MGYFPGGDRLTSDLAHYIGAGQLVRALVRSADGRIAAAFARGWATHVLADVLLHPLVNRAVGEWRGAASGAMTFADDPAAHIRVEQGMDAVLADRCGARALWPGRTRAVLPPVVWLLATAYRATYRFAPSKSALAASCRALRRGTPLLLRYGRAAVHLFARRAPARGAFAAARFATWLFPNSPAHSFARPCRPPDWLIAESLRVMTEFPTRFAALEANGFADLPDYNLDTGELEDAPYPPSRATREQLRTRVAGEPRG
jgi:hypothetical protein